MALVGGGWRQSGRARKRTRWWEVEAGGTMDWKKNRVLLRSLLREREDRRVSVLCKCVTLSGLLVLGFFSNFLMSLWPKCYIFHYGSLLTLMAHTFCNSLWVIHTNGPLPCLLSSLTTIHSFFSLLFETSTSFCYSATSTVSISLSLWSIGNEILLPHPNSPVCSRMELKMSTCDP